VQMGKLNKDAVLVLLFWLVYHEAIATIVSFGTGFSWWWLQIPVILVSLLMVSLTYGSQTKSDRNWYEND
jgi:hypothetical protein